MKIVHYVYPPLLAFTFQLAKAQTTAIGEFNRSVIAKATSVTVRVGPYKVKGSPFLLGEAFQGFIKYTNNTSITQVNILYDTYNQKVGKAENNELIEANEPVQEFFLTLPEKYGAAKLLFRNGAYYGEASGKHYYNVLVQGEKISLLKLFKNKVVPDPENLYSKDERIFEQSYEYYMYDAVSKSVSRLKLREKELLGKLNDQGKLKAFLQTNKLDITNEADLVQLFGFANTTP